MSIVILTLRFRMDGRNLAPLRMHRFFGHVVSTRQSAAGFSAWKFGKLLQPKTFKP